MTEHSSRRVSLSATLHDSVREPFRNGLNLFVLVVVLDFLIWGAVVELPAKYGTYLAWRVPPLAGVVGWLSQLESQLLLVLFRTDQGWARMYTLSKTLHTAVYLVAVLNVSILVLHGGLSVAGTLDQLTQAKTWQFFRDVWRTTRTVLLFVLFALLVTGIFLVGALVGVELLGPDDYVRAALLQIVFGVVVVALVNVLLSRWLLIAPVCVLEKAGLDSFARSWEYTGRFRLEVWLLYTIHTVAFVVAVLLIPMESNEIAVVILNALLPIFVVWHSALSLTCYYAAIRSVPRQGVHVPG